jgi:hypothetical protein
MPEYKCESCGKTFAKAAQLRGHLMGEKRRNQRLQAKVDSVQAEQIKVKNVKLPERPVSKIKPYDFTRYTSLPAEIQDFLKKTWGNWLNHFEIGMEDKKDFGGFAVYVRVPKEYSTEWKTVKYMKYDNATRRATGDYDVEVEDIRWCSLKDRQTAMQWIEKVKEHIINNAFPKGVQLPTMNVQIAKQNQTLEDYKKSLIGI